MAHDKQEIRLLTYQGWSWPIMHNSAPSWKDDRACYICDHVEWELSDDDLIENLILQGVVLHNQGAEYGEDEIYSLIVHNKGEVTPVQGFVADGLWFSQGTNLPLLGRIEVKEYGRDEFMAYFRGDRIHEELSTDDCVEVFLGILKGSSAIKRSLLEELCRNYGGVNFDRLLKG